MVIKEYTLRYKKGELIMELAKKIFWITTAILIALLLILDICYYFDGSLEDHPTEEQEEKVKIATVMFSVPLIAIEILALYMVFRKKEHP